MPIQPSTDALGIYSYGDGSNLRVGTNPTFTADDFLQMYPQFQSVISQVVLQTFIDMANASVQQARWRGAWKLGMSLFIAHFCTLWLQTSADPSSDAATVFEAGKAQGVLTGESVGDVSYSADASAGSVDGWAAWNLTAYDQQLATLARMYGKGGMQIW